MISLGRSPRDVLRVQQPMSEMGVRRAKAALSSGCKSHPATAPAGSNRSSHGGNEVAEAFDCSKRDRIQRTQRVWLQVCGAQDGLRGAKPSSWVGCYHRNDRHGEQRRPEPKPLLRGIGLQLVHFPFASAAGTTTWPSLKTARNTEANAGSSRIASATLNDGSGFHSAPLLTSDSAAAFIA